MSRFIFDHDTLTYQNCKPGTTQSQLEIHYHDKYVSKIHTTNNTFNPTNSNHLIKDYYNFQAGYPQLNQTLQRIYHNDILNWGHDVSRSLNTLTNLNLNLHQLPQPVYTNMTESGLKLHFELPHKSKIFSTVRPDLSNTCFNLTERTDITKSNCAYVVLYFPSSLSYLLPTLLVGWMLKNYPQNYQRRQQGLTGTAANTICLITPDVIEEERVLLRKFFDTLVEAPYLTWDQTCPPEHRILIRDLSKGRIPPRHIYNRVTTKFWIFDPIKFPYEKVILLDSDLFPLGYFDTLFSLDAPSGWLEHQRRQLNNLGVSSWINDRGTRIRHGEAIPQDLTNLENLHASDINASLLVIQPDRKLFQNIMKDLKKNAFSIASANSLRQGEPDSLSSSDDEPKDARIIPPIISKIGEAISSWFENENETVEGSWAGDKYYPFYMLPEQNYLTQKFSGKWKSIDLGFCSWLLDPEHCFGFTFAGFNVKPWRMQSAGQKYSLNPYSKFSQLNNRDTNRSFGIQLFNLLLVQMLQANPKTPWHRLIQLKLVDHVFDPWEPEISFSEYPKKFALTDPSITELFSPDQLLLAYTLTNNPSTAVRLQSAIKFCEEANQVQTLGTVALNYYFLKQLTKNRQSVFQFCLLSPTNFSWLPVTLDHLTVGLNTNGIQLITEFLKTGCYRVFVNMNSTTYQVIDPSNNLPLDYFCQLKPPEVKFISLEQLKSQQNKIVSFNFSLSEPVWQELKQRTNLETTQKNHVFGHNHYEWRPFIEFVVVSNINIASSKQLQLQYIDFVNEFVVVQQSTETKLSPFVHHFRKDIEQLYQTIRNILDEFSL